MFDVGFSEMLVIGIVALLVIGPEKLPSVARTVGALLGRMQRYVNDVKADINREIELDELKKLQTTVQDAARSIETSVNDTMSTFQTQADELNKIASGDIAGLTETKPNETNSAEAGTSGTSGSSGSSVMTGTGTSDTALIADTTAIAGDGAAAAAVPQTDSHADAMAMLAAAEAAPGPAAMAEHAAEGAAQSGSQSGSQGTLALEAASTNAPSQITGAKSATVPA